MTPRRVISDGPEHIGDWVEFMPVSEHEDEIRTLCRSVANVDAAIWGGLRMIDQGREAQGLSLIRSCLPDGYEPYAW